MVVVGKLVGTFEPAWVTVAIAQTNSASARANTIAPSQPVGRNEWQGQSPASTVTAHAIGGRKMTFAVSVVSAIAGPLNLAPLSMWEMSNMGRSPPTFRLGRPAGIVKK